jgi:HEPN domain-containing protein
MKQTAVEWLQQALEDTILDYEQIMQTIGLFEQAKEMEKEQIIDAWRDGWLNDYEYDEDVKNSAEHYYNETFNTKEK